MLNNLFPPKIVPFVRYLEQQCTARQATDGNTIRHTVCVLVPKARNALSEYAIFMAFPLQQQLHEHVSVTIYRHCDTAGLHCAIPTLPVSVLCNTDTGTVQYLHIQNSKSNEHNTRTITSLPLCFKLTATDDSC